MLEKPTHDEKERLLRASKCYMNAAQVCEEASKIEQRNKRTKQRLLELCRRFSKLLSEM